MRPLARPTTYLYGCTQQSPADRISATRIVNNIETHRFSAQLLNNMKITLNCTKIAIRYSKCYMCKLPLVRYPLRMFYGTGDNDRIMGRINGLFVQQFPFDKFRPLFRMFNYENKGIYAALSMIKTESLTASQQETAVKFLTALELVNLGFSLHHSVGKSYRLNLVTRMALRMMSKQMKDSYLVLGGDYFHIKGSLLAADTHSIKLSQILSDVEVDSCKYVHLTEQLKGKIVSSGYDSVNIREIYNISVLKISPVVNGLIAMDYVTGRNEAQIAKMKQIYEIIGLIMLYRKDLQNFMFNFKTILKKYTEYTQNRINFDTQQSLPYFIFFQGAQNNKRIDTAYLNTVQMMSQEIQYLQKKLSQLSSEETVKQIRRKMNYYLMIYS